jgi:hypothetical protein
VAGGEVAQPRKPPPDLGTQPFTMPQRSPSVKYTRDARTRDPFPVCLLGTQDVMLQFWGPTGMQCMALTKSLLYVLLASAADWTGAIIS